MEKRKGDREWFRDETFWENFAPVMFDQRRWGEVSELADGITRFSGLDLYGEGGGRHGRAGGPPRVLDLCCGFGRITLELARCGYDAVGVDITPSYIEAAREAAAYEKLDAEFILDDVRSFRRRAAFDVALNLYISFGYFEDPADDALLVQNAFDSLGNGGTFIVETLGKETAVRDFIEGEWFERAGYTVLTEYEAIDAWSALKNRWILIKDGERIEKTFTQRLYSASELKTLFLEAGFSSAELYGDWDASPYDHNARMLIAVGRKSG